MPNSHAERISAARAEHLAFSTGILEAYETVTAEMTDPADEPTRQAIAAQVQQLIYEHRRDTAAKHKITLTALLST